MSTCAWSLGPISTFLLIIFLLDGERHATSTELRQLQHLGARFYACGPSMEHYKVDPDHLAIDDVTISAYLTFMEQLDTADIHLVA